MEKLILLFRKQQQFLAVDLVSMDFILQLIGFFLDCFVIEICIFIWGVQYSNDMSCWSVESQGKKLCNWYIKIDT